MQPTLQVVHVRVTKIFAASDPKVTLDPDATPVDAGSVEVKGYGLGKSVWDDQW